MKKVETDDKCRGGDVIEDRPDSTVADVESVAEDDAG